VAAERLDHVKVHIASAGQEACRYRQASTLNAISLTLELDLDLDLLLDKMPIFRWDPGRFQTGPGRGTWREYELQSVPAGDDARSGFGREVSSHPPDTQQPKRAAESAVCTCMPDSNLLVSASPN